MNAVPRVVVCLTPQQIEHALPLVKPGLSKYLLLQAVLHRCDVSKDTDYQRRFNGFYRVRRNTDWRLAFFALLEEAKSTPLTFHEVLTRLHTATGRIEASFASKLVATVEPSQPVIDSEVFRFLGLRLAARGDSFSRIQRIVSQHQCLGEAYETFLRTAAGRQLVARFTTTFRDIRISEVKMLDLVLWKSRSARKRETSSQAD